MYIAGPHPHALEPLEDADLFRGVTGSGFVFFVFFSHFNLKGAVSWRPSSGDGSDPGSALGTLFRSKSHRHDDVAVVRAVLGGCGPQQALGGVVLQLEGDLGGPGNVQEVEKVLAVEANLESAPW